MHVVSALMLMSTPSEFLLLDEEFDGDRKIDGISNETATLMCHDSMWTGHCELDEAA